MSDESLEDRVDELEEYIEHVHRGIFENWKTDVYRREMAEAEAERDDARKERVELQAAVDALESRVTELERTLESVVGLDDATNSNPTKRANDLRLALIRDAEDRSDEHEGRSQMWWQDVQRFFAQTGHGEVSKPDCYKAMRWAAGHDHAPDAFQPGDGFGMTTKTNADGREVKAVRVDLAAVEAGEVASYRDSSPDTRSSSPTTGETPQHPEHTV